MSDLLEHIAEMYQDSVNVYKKYNMEKLIPLDNGKRDPRRYLMISGEEKYLLVEASMDLYYRKNLQYFYLRDIADVDINMPKILHKNCQKNLAGETKFFHVFTYVEGEPMREYLSAAEPDAAYAMGVQAGEALRKLHSAKMDRQVMPWWTLHGWAHDRCVREYVPAPELDRTFDYYQNNSSLMDGRQNVFLNYNVTIDNLLVCDGKIGFDDFGDIGTGDTYYDFRYCSLIASENADFANGLINGYFENNVPEGFFKLLKYYTCELILTDLRSNSETELIGKIRDFYDDFELDVPKWYNKIV